MYEVNVIKLFDSSDFNGVGLSEKEILRYINNLNVIIEFMYKGFPYVEFTEELYDTFQEICFRYQTGENRFDFYEIHFLGIEAQYVFLSQLCNETSGIARTLLSDTSYEVKLLSIYVRQHLFERYEEYLKERVRTEELKRTRKALDSLYLDCIEEILPEIRELGAALDRKEKRESDFLHGR